MHYCCHLCKNCTALNHVRQFFLLQVFGLRLAIANDSKTKIFWFYTHHCLLTAFNDFSTQNITLLVSSLQKPCRDKSYLPMFNIANLRAKVRDCQWFQTKDFAPSIFSLTSTISMPQRLHSCCQLCKHCTAIHHFWQLFVLQVFGFRLAIANHSKSRISWCYTQPCYFIDFNTPKIALLLSALQKPYRDSSCLTTCYIATLRFKANDQILKLSNIYQT